MSKYYTDECCDCASPLYPCTNCGLRQMPHHQCDECDSTDEDTKIYKFDGRELCIKCIENELDEA